jgi:hypothetical protein
MRVLSVDTKAPITNGGDADQRVLAARDWRACGAV